MRAGDGTSLPSGFSSGWAGGAPGRLEVGPQVARAQLKVATVGALRGVRWPPGVWASLFRRPPPCLRQEPRAWVSSFAPTETSSAPGGPRPTCSSQPQRTPCGKPFSGSAHGHVFPFGGLVAGCLRQCRFPLTSWTHGLPSPTSAPLSPPRGLSSWSCGSVQTQTPDFKIICVFRVLTLRGPSVSHTHSWDRLVPKRTGNCGPSWQLIHGSCNERPPTAVDRDPTCNFTR